MTTRPLYVYILAAFLSAIIASCVLLTVTNLYSTYLLHKQLISERDDRAILLFSRYAVVDDVDVAQRTLLIRVLYRRYATDFNPEPFMVKVADTAHIAKQELLGKDGVYDSVSEETPSLLSAIKPGARILVTLVMENGVLVARRILFGNPI